MGFGVWGLWLGPGFEVLGFGVWGLELRDSGFGFYLDHELRGEHLVEGSRSRAQIFGVRVPGSGFRFEGSGFRFQGSELRFQFPVIRKKKKPTKKVQGLRWT